MSNTSNKYRRGRDQKLPMSRISVASKTLPSFLCLRACLACQETYSARVLRKCITIKFTALPSSPKTAAELFIVILGSWRGSLRISFRGWIALLPKQLTPYPWSKSRTKRNCFRISGRLRSLYRPKNKRERNSIRNFLMPRACWRGWQTNTRKQARFEWWVLKCSERSHLYPSETLNSKFHFWI